MNFDQMESSDGNGATNINTVCQNMLDLRVSGNVTPISWYKHIQTETKKPKPDVTAITILSDILYWYTPTIIRDEITGDFVGIKQKFRADKLQKTYQEYSDIFGFSKNQVKAAIDNLVRKELITREFRNIKTKTGLSINNVMYIEPVLENIVKISNKIRSPQKVGGYPLKKMGDTPKQNGTVTSEKNEDLPWQNGHTNTENTPSENTTTTTTPGVDVVSSVTGIPDKLSALIPEIYRGHKGVLKTLSNFINSRGIDYVEKELRYAADNSSKEGGFPAFLKQALENGWGAETVQVQQAIDEKKQRDLDRQEQKQKIEQKKIQEQQAQIAEKQQDLENRLKTTISGLSQEELEKFRGLARKEAEKRVPRPKGYNAQLVSLAKEKLSSLPEQERHRIRAIAESSTRDAFGDSYSSKNPGFAKAAENRMARIVRETYHISSPKWADYENRVHQKAETLMNKIICKEFNLLCGYEKK